MEVEGNVEERKEQEDDGDFVFTQAELDEAARLEAEAIGDDVQADSAAAESPDFSQLPEEVMTFFE